MQGRGIQRAVGGADAHEDVGCVGLRVLDRDVEVAVVLEDARVQELVLGIGARAALVLLDEVRVRESPLRIFVEELHVRVARHVVEVEVVLLHVLAVIALVAREAEHALLEDRVGAVPERECEAKLLVLVADARDAVLAPAVGARARVIVREVLPRRAAGAVVLAHRAPLPLREVRSPQAPRRLALACRGESCFLFGHGAAVSACAPRHVCAGASVTLVLDTAASMQRNDRHSSGVEVRRRGAGPRIPYDRIGGAGRADLAARGSAHAASEAKAQRGRRGRAGGRRKASHRAPPRHPASTPCLDNARRRGLAHEPSARHPRAGSYEAPS